jgi:FkbM family methyltransferase
MRWQRVLRGQLDRSWFRWALAGPASLRESRVHREPVLVYPHARPTWWVHRDRRRSYVWPGLRAFATSAGFDREAVDIFLWGAVIAPGDTIVDVGAGIGEETYVLSHAVGPTGRVIAVEAHPTSFALLEENCRRNRLDNVTVVHGAVTDHTGTVTITDDGTSVANRLADSGIEVAATTVSALLDDHDLASVALLKMNIEGAERLAVRGISHVAERIDRLVVSCHDFLAERSGDQSLATRGEVSEMLTLAGYAITTRPDDPARPWVRDYLYADRSSSAAGPVV